MRAPSFLRSGDKPGPVRTPPGGLRIPALAPLYRPAGLTRRWTAFVLDLALSLIFTFGWAAGVILFLFLVNTLFDLDLWLHLRYGQSAALTLGLFFTLFAVPYAGYYLVPLRRAGRTAGLFLLHLRMVRGEARPGAGREPVWGVLGLGRAFPAALPALFAGLIAISLLPDATDRPVIPALLGVLRLPSALLLGAVFLSQIADRLRGREATLGFHERLAGVRVVREPRLRELMERERRITEAHIAGGMAHEIRNALGTARLQLDRVAGLERSARLQRALEDILGVLTRGGMEAGDREDLKRAVAGVREIYEAARLDKRALDEVSAAVDRGLGITRRVMDYSKIRTAAGENGGPGGAADLNALLSGLADSYRESLEGEGIRIQLDLGFARPIHGNAGQCYSVFQNLLLNARDAIREKRTAGGPAEGTIRIATGDGERVWARIMDDGAGIPAEHLERIFDPFFSTKPSSGMGLGLNECRRIVDLYGGEIRVESQAGRGTQFTVLWRAAEPAPDAEGQKAGG